MDVLLRFKVDVNQLVRTLDLAERRDRTDRIKPGRFYISRGIDNWVSLGGPGERDVRISGGRDLSFVRLQVPAERWPGVRTYWHDLVVELLVFLVWDASLVVELNPTDLAIIAEVQRSGVDVGDTELVKVVGRSREYINKRRNQMRDLGLQV